MRFKRTFLIAVTLGLSACATSDKKQTVELGQGGKPDWVNSTKMTWTDGEQVYYRTQYAIRGDERLNGCYELAKIDAKDSLLREIAEDIRGQIDSAHQSISENAEILLNQSHASEFKGRVTGFRNVEQFHERYKANGTERIDCYVLSSINKSDYESIRRAVIYKLVDVDPGLKKAINQHQIDFFMQKPSATTAQVDEVAK